MRCTNKIKFLISISMIFILLTGCGKVNYQMAYNPNYPVSSFCVTNYKDVSIADAFASNLCVTKGNVEAPTPIVLDNIGCAGLFSLNDERVIYANNVHAQMSPASLTKVLTALTAIQNCSLDQIMTASENVVFDDPYVQSFGLKPGDKMTLNQALHIMLVNSSNDVAVMIAENIAGSVEEFSNMMNATARKVGATNSHFVNPHGLTASDHYTTAYDMYLMFQALIQYEEIREIISLDSYTTVYTDANGNQKEQTVKSTNQYLTKNYTPPGNITIVGGKTGTTNAAGNCLILLVKDTAGNQYILIIMRALERSILYNHMNTLLSLI